MLRFAARKRQVRHVLALFLCLAATACSGELSSGAAIDECRVAVGELRDYRVEQVTDGDTLRLAGGERVRLIGINTPELGRDGAADQALAGEARAALSERAAKRVWLLDGPDARDDYGRRLAWAFDAEGNSLSAALIGRGLGFHVAIAPNTAMAGCLAAAEAEARRHGRGVWNEPAYQPRSVARLMPGYRGFALLEDRVTHVSFKDNGWWVQLGGKIGVKIAPEKQHLYSRGALAALEGETVSVRGWLVPMPGDWWVLTLGAPAMLQPASGRSVAE